jgi:glycosyltransferase involved in cell wall biosynthesis
VIKSQSMLLVLGLPFKREGDRLLCESQALNGLQRWADNFESIILAAPVMPAQVPFDWSNQGTWLDVATLERPERFEFVPLPWAFSLPDFVRNYAATRSLLAKLIARCEYIQLALEWLIGDWAAIAALEAIHQGRPYAIHKDIVSHKLLLQTSQGKSLKTRLMAQLKAPIMQAYHQWIIRRAGLGLWHGADCYNAYQPFCANSYLIHDIHTKSTDLLDSTALADKCRESQTGVLRICYVGRMTAMKAPQQWVKALGKAKELGAEFTATWVGEGELRSDTEAAIAQLGLGDRIQLTGFETDRERVLDYLRAAHILVFTHITLESPRCLIEALISGTPIIGYDSAYVHDLVKDNSAAGVFVPIGNWQQLAAVILEIDRDRPALARRILAAAACGQHFSDEAVFRERSSLIKHHLGQSTDTAATLQDETPKPRPYAAIDVDRLAEAPDPQAPSAIRPSPRK